MGGPGALTRRMRQRCSQCGGGVRWFSRREAKRSLDLRDFVAEVEEVMPVESVWRCVMCGELGAFGPLECG